ncbi:Guanine deaminase [Operophtera brumata]|uniref:Guanine deaminase n=1 Tax=Operophtera brumata TaxID=104452 RepID=A0A0L7LPY7_OPEBR|nr:Guanine deaminase [Operophtera brumata]
MTDKKTVFVGTIASSVSLNELDIYNGFLSVENGKITNKGTIQEFEQLQNAGAFTNFGITQLGEDQFLMPGFVDCHTHASQFPNIGLGLDRPLLEWLPKYTYPLEKKYSDVEFAAQVYDKVVQRLLQNGTTTACYFGTTHLEGTMQLVKSAIQLGQRALVGVVSMNSHISENLQEIEHVLKRNPNCSSFAEVYDTCHLLNNKCL